MAKIPYKPNVAADRWAYENAERWLITRQTALRESVILGELLEKDIDADEITREFKRHS